MFYAPTTQNKRRGGATVSVRTNLASESRLFFQIVLEAEMVTNTSRALS